MISTAAGKVTAIIHMHWGGVAVSPDGTRAYVTNVGTGTVSVLGTTTNQVIATIGVGQYPYGVAVSPDGTLAYVTDQQYPGSMSVISTATDQVTATIGGLSNPYGVAVAPGGTHIYVTNPPRDTVSVIPRQ